MDLATKVSHIQDGHPPPPINDPTKHYPFPMYLAIATLVVSCVGVLANVAILWVIAKARELHSRCYVLMAILAVVDTFVCLYYAQLR